MVVEKSIQINAPIDKVWETFTKLSHWEEWCTVVDNLDSDSTRLIQGESFKFRIRPFDFPLNIKPMIEEIVEQKRAVWTGRKYWISARHEFMFEHGDGQVVLTSRETFTGAILKPLWFLFPKKKLQDLSFQMLRDLKNAAEAKVALKK
jgi:hypothetical protein